MEMPFPFSCCSNRTIRKLRIVAPWGAMLRRPNRRSCLSLEVPRGPYQQATPQHQCYQPLRGPVVGLSQSLATGADFPGLLLPRSQSIDQLRRMRPPEGCLTAPHNMPEARSTRNRKHGSRGAWLTGNQSTPHQRGSLSRVLISRLGDRKLSSAGQGRRQFFWGIGTPIEKAAVLGRLAGRA